MSRLDYSIPEHASATLAHATAHKIPRPQKTAFFVV